MTEERTTDAAEAETPAAEDEGGAAGGQEDLPLDVVFGILKNRRRRLVLRYLVDVSETTTLSQLAEHIAALENDKTEQELTSSERKRVYVCLYQCHLPKMDDAGVIDFETDRGTVELESNVEEFTQYLETDAEEPERDWPRYYVALAAVGGGAFLAQRLLYPSAVASGIVIGVTIGLFANLALEHAYKRDLLRPSGDDGGEETVATAEPA